MRIAWFGDVVGEGGVPGIGRRLLEGLLVNGHTVDVYTGDFSENLAVLANQLPKFNTVHFDNGWRWGRWYSRKSYLAFVSGLIGRKYTHGRLCQLLVKNHAEQPYDCVFQLSQMELFEMGRHLHELPPVVIYPCVHAAGELTWHRQESDYARRVENPIIHFGTRLYLIYRSRVQRREVKKPAKVIGMSQRFNELLRQDYGVDFHRQAVLYNSIKPPSPGSRRIAEANKTGRPLLLFFVARISVRKGVEQIIELSKRLDDMGSKVEIHVIGGATMWSDYRGHLKDLNPRIAKYLGRVSNDKIMSAFDEGDALLLPSLYEPGGIVVGEALSRGLPVVVNEEIGSAEPVEGACCRRFRAGDMDGFEREVRRLIADLLVDPTSLRASAFEQAQLHFAPDKIASNLQSILENVTFESHGERQFAAAR